MALQQLRLDTRISRKESVLASQLDGETVLLDVDAGNYYAFDAIASRIWDLIAQPQTVGEVCRAMALHYDVESERCQRDVLAFLDDLLARGLLRCDAKGPEASGV